MPSMPIIAIFLCFAGIIALVVVSSIGPGLDVIGKTVESLPLQKLSSSQSNERIVIQDWTITNRYFIPRAYEFPKVKACLYKSDGKIKGQSVSISYGESIAASSPFSLGSKADIASYNFRYYPESAAAQQRVEVPGGSSKKVQLLLAPSYYGTYDNSLKDYDELLLIKDNAQNDYLFCQNIGDETRKNAIKIQLTNAQENTASAQSSGSCNNGACSFVVSAKNIFENGGYSTGKAYDSKQFVSEGQTLTFQANGCWTCDSNNYPCNSDWINKGGCYAPNVGRLEGQVGDCQHFIVGSSSIIHASCSGNLYLGMYDLYASNNDNAGSVNVTLFIS